jgi:hypothetical protein
LPGYWKLSEAREEKVMALIQLSGMFEELRGWDPEKKKMSKTYYGDMF